MDYYVEIYGSDGTTIVGPGPISTVISWQQTVRINRAGDFEFRMLADDPQATNLALLNTVKCIAFVRGGYNASTVLVFTDKYIYIGGGIIQNISTEIDDSGRAILVVSGQDWLGELAWVSMDRNYFDGNTTPPAGGIDLITASNAALFKMASPQTGWTATAGGTVFYDTLYGRWAYENVLQALIKLSEYSGAYFALSPNLSTAITGTGFRTIRWEASFIATNIRAVQVDGNSDVRPDTVIIKNITMFYSMPDFVTRVIPFGAGNGDSRLTMLPSSITVNPSFDYVTVAGQYKGIRHTGDETTFGVHTRVIQWPEVAPESNTTTAIEKAADQLYYLALNYLIKNRQPIIHYDIELTKSLVTVSDSTELLLRPLHKIRVQYRDPEQGIYIDDSLNIIEATHVINADGMQTTKILVGTVETYPATDTEATVSRLSDADTYKVASQMMPNTHTMTFSRPVGLTQSPVTEIRFRLGSDVVQIYSVFFDFFISPIISTISSITATANEVAEHTHTSPLHKHSIPDHNHTSPSHAHVETGGTTQLTTVTINLKTNFETNDTADSVNSGGSHTHTITPTVTYNAYRGGSNYAHTDLEYRLNGSGANPWTAFDAAVVSGGSESISGNWRRINLTSSIRNANTLRPNQAHNLIEVRRKSASTENTAQLEVQITIQSTVQTIV